MYFSKSRLHTVYNGVWGKAARSWGFAENFFVLKVRLLLTVSAENLWGSMMHDLLSQ